VGFLKEEQADLLRSQSPANFLHVLFESSILSRESMLLMSHSLAFVTVPPFVTGRHRPCRLRYETTPEELPSFHARGQAPSTFHRMSRPFRRRLIGWLYRFALLPEGSRLHCRRSRTFTGQCCQPFCPGDPTSHSDGPRVVTKYRHAKERIKLLRLHQARELGLPSEPNRDTPRTIFTWPLRRRSLPPDAGCVPSNEVRVKISGPAWTCPGRIRFHRISFHDKISPFSD